MLTLPCFLRHPSAQRINLEEVFFVSKPPCYYVQQQEVASAVRIQVAEKVNASHDLQ